MMKSTLIITTYNWPEALELVLMSVLKQKMFPTEVIVADDGSKEDTKNLVERFKNKFPIPLVYLWHEDEGFRRSTMLNKAITIAKGDYIIQLDGDCIIHKSFVKDHLNAVEKNTFLFGSRVNIQQSFLKKLYAEKIISFSFFVKGIKKRTRNIHLPFFGKLYKPSSQLSKKLRGCNLSYWKSDFIAINGYNENMIGWGREDSELVIRMLNNGIVSKRLRYRAIVYHIWHNENSKERLDINHSIQQETIKEKSTWCVNGIDKYLNG